MIQHDVTSPRPYSRIHLVSGTKGVACKYPEPGKIASGHEWFDEARMKEIEKSLLLKLSNALENWQRR